MIEPVWLTKARADIGVAETPGRETAPAIRRWLIDLGAWWADDETAWCGVAVAHWMRAADVPRPKAWYRAQAWLDWGHHLSRPVLGAVVIFDRGGGKGHVGLAVGRTNADELLVIGGNQRNRVGIDPIARARLLGSRWPTEHVADWGWHLDSYLPLLASTGPVSRNEA